MAHRQCRRRRRPIRPSQVSLAIQAGGASRRMGVDKALVDLAGQPLIARVIGRVAPSFGHAFIVSNKPAQLRHLGLPVLTDAVSERGSVVGIYTSLLATPTEHVLCLACDMPFVDPLLLRCLAQAAPGYEVVVACHGDYREPMAAVYARSAVPVVEDFMAEGGRRPRPRSALASCRRGGLGDGPLRPRNLPPRAP